MREDQLFLGAIAVNQTSIDYDINTDVGRWVMVGVWCFVFVVALIVELTTTNFFTLVTALAAIPSALIAGFVPFVWWLIIVQIAVFGVLWVLLYLLFFYGFKVRQFMHGHYRSGPGIDLIDKELILETAASNINWIPSYGKAKVGDVNYLVLPIDPIRIPEKVAVRVVKIDGATLLVEPLEHRGNGY